MTRPIGPVAASIVIVLTGWASRGTAQELRAGAQVVKAGGRSFRAQVVRVRLSSVRLRIGLGGGQVGRVESLAGIASRYGAVAAINGSFFDAYTSSTLKNPHHTLITDRRLVHVGRVGTVLGFGPGRAPLMGRLPVQVIGGLDGRYKWPDRWYAYWLNRKPEGADTVTIFTREWGGGTTPPDGVQAVVDRGRVVRMTTGSQPIPRQGYVVYFRGAQKAVARPFRTGRRCDWRWQLANGADPGPWRQVTEALGAGPRLLRQGKVCYDPKSEGFSHPKILSLSATRSMVGVTRDGWLLLVTSSGTVRQMADVMKALGAWDAMNLDGGASSGLWAGGKYLTTPGREISNALVVLRPSFPWAAALGEVTQRERLEWLGGLAW